MNSPGKFAFGVTECSPHTVADLLGELRLLLSDRALRPRTILCVNAHIYNLACKDERLRECLRAARIVAADGMAIVWSARWLGQAVRERCNMTEAYHAFLAAEPMPKSQAVLVGCSLNEAQAAAEKANRTSAHCRIAACNSGYLDEAGFRAFLDAHAGCDFVFLGMGTPKTERFALIAAEICPSAIVWGIGGGTIRIEAGTMREAPSLWRKLGLQWLHRLGAEPGSMWRRYLIGNPLFLLRMIRAAGQRKTGR